MTLGSSGAGSCREAVTPLLQAAQDLSARLKVGVPYDDYVKAVGDLSVADSRIGQTSANCAGVLRKLRGVILWYKRGVQDFRVDPQLDWRKAEQLREEAEQLLAHLG